MGGALLAALVVFTHGVSVPPVAPPPASPPLSTPPPSAESTTTLAAVQAQLDGILTRHANLPEPPCVVLAGHHNDGKSALCEALLGLRLCHVGASSTTRRPLRIHAQHDAACDEPQLFLQRDPSSSEERASVAEVRTFVESENVRLAASGGVEDAEIRVRVRWRLAPNVVLVDTPALLSIPKDSPVADANLARASEAAERILLAQLKPPTRLCLCLEDTADWQLSPTCAVVRKADASLSRTLLVATKLDAKLKQFSMAEDLHRLLNPQTISAAHPRLLGGPIFTCVPPTRDASSTQALHEGVAREEASTRRMLSERLGSDVYSSRIGVVALRGALQPHIDHRWHELLNAASQSVDAQLQTLQKQLQAPPEAEGETLDDFVHRFCLSVHQLLRGSIALEPATHGETLQQEISMSHSGALCEIKRPEAALRQQASTEASKRGLSVISSGGSAAASVGEAAMLESAAARAESGADPDGDAATMWLHAGKRLFGGAQYWRAMHEFMLGASQLEHEEVRAPWHRLNPAKLHTLNRPPTSTTPYPLGSSFLSLATRASHPRAGVGGGDRQRHGRRRLPRRRQLHACRVCDCHREGARLL